MTMFKLLKDNPGIVARTGPAQWTRRQAAHGSGKYLYMAAPDARADRDRLAPNDIKALEESLVFVVKQGIRKNRRLTHADPPYLAAVEMDPIGRNASTDYTLLHKSRDLELTRVLTERSMNF